MKSEIDLTRLWTLIRQNFHKLLYSILGGIILMAIMVFFIIPPKYSSQTQLIAQLPQQKQMVGNDVNNNLMMINTYKDLVKSNLVIDDATRELNEKYNYHMNSEELNKCIKVSQEQNSQMFTIKAISDNPNEAKNMANVVAEVFRKKVSNVMKVDKISITSKATVNNRPVSPNKIIGLFIGVLLGGIVGLLWIVLINLKDKTVKSEEWLTDTLGVTILGNIPKMSDKDFSRVSAK